MKCLSCVVAAKQAEAAKPDELPPPVADAITMVPVWKTQVIGPGQQVVMCVPELVCWDHLVIQSVLVT